jgi:hypothetical protein
MELDDALWETLDDKKAPSAWFWHSRHADINAFEHGSAQTSVDS